MPNKTTGKNTKGKKAPAKKASANAANRNTNAAKKNVTNKNVASKKASAKGAHARNFEAVTIEENITTENNVKNKKGNKCGIKGNKPFTIMLVICILLTCGFITTIAFMRVVPKVKNGNEILVSLKGKNITAQKLYEDLRSQYGDEVLVNMIDSYIADKEVKITEDDEKYVDEVVDYYKQYADYYGTDLATFLANYVGLKGITTEKEFREFVLKDYKKTLAVQYFIGNKASEKDLKAYYKENFTDKITAKHILISIDSENEDTEAAEKEALDKAKDIIKQLNKTSKGNLESKFDELAEANSDDTATYSNGGLMEEFAKKDVEEAFYNAANDLKDGEYTKEPVKTSYGYHIILKKSSTPAEKYSKVKNKVKKEYAQSLMSEDATLAIKEWKKLRKKYKMSIKDTEMKKAYEKNIKASIESVTSGNETKDETTEETKTEE